jgi:hypothetical protein
MGMCMRMGAYVCLHVYRLAFMSAYAYEPMCIHKRKICVEYEFTIIQKKKCCNSTRKKNVSC